MSLELYAFLKGERLPDRARWQDSISAIGFPLQLDPALDPSSDTGFSPCQLVGQQSGFEIYHGPAQEILASYPHLATVVGDRDYTITFCWGGDLRECGCVLGAAAALVKDFDAVTYYPDDDIVTTDFQELVAEARQCLE